jgi:hypothetical protein
MFPGGSIAIYALFLVQASAQIEAGMRIETRAGEAPTGTQQVTSGQTGQTVTVAAEQAQVMVVCKLTLPPGFSGVRFPCSTHGLSSWKPWA